MKIRCTKCKNDGHKTRGCKTPWPSHAQQECDKCFASSHEVKDCSGKNDMTQVCKFCGHAEDHQPQLCPLKDPKIPAVLAQYTKSAYDRAMKLQPTKSKKGNPTTLVHLPGPSSAALSRNSAPRLDPTNQLETEPIVPLNHKAPILDPIEQEKYQWADATLESIEYEVQEIARPVNAVANFFQVKYKDQSAKCHRYKIELGPIFGKPVKKVETKKALIWKLLNVQRPPLVPFASDYCQYVVSKGPLYQAFTDHHSSAYSVPHRRTPREGEQPERLATIFYCEGECKASDMVEYFNSILAVPRVGLAGYRPEKDLHTLNIISWTNINNLNSFGGGLHGKKFYPEDFSRASPLGNADSPYLVSRGFFTSMRPGARGLLLNVNPTTSAFFSDRITLQEWIVARGGTDSHGNPVASVQEELMGRRVTFWKDPLQSNQKRKQRVIMGFHGKASQCSFTKDGESSPTMFLQHMQQKYNLVCKGEACIIDVGNPSGTPPNHKFYSADQLRLVEWQHVRGKIHTDYSALMLTHAQQRPNVNKNDILWKACGPLGFPKLNSNPPNGVVATRPANHPLDWGRNFFKTFGLEVNPNLVQVYGRYLKHPDLFFAGASPKVLEKNNLGFKASWNLQHIKFLKPPSMNVKLGIVRLGLQVKDRDWESPYKAFGVAFKEHMGGYGVSFRGTFKLVTANYQENMNRAEICRALSGAHDQIRNYFKDLPDLMILVLPKRHILSYQHIKWWADCGTGSPSICLTERVMKLKNKKNETVADANMLGNVSLKANIKLGGITHRLSNSPKWWGALEKTMIVGADVTHPGENIVCPSMAGIVATYDDVAAHYLASARLHRGAQEYIVDLDAMMKERTMVYFHNMRHLPEHVLFYRDGVSEGQFGMVKEKEFPLIRKGCMDAAQEVGLLANYELKITLVVVGKRHHTRFFPASEPRAAGKVSHNFQSGFIVDTVVTSPMKSDFYLQSHDCALGTARAAHYIIIENESGYKMDQLQELTNKLAYTGARATKALAVCTPARYADSLCDRLRCYMQPYLAMRIQPGNTHQLTTIKADRMTWGRNRGPNTSQSTQRENPWHPKLDKIMFYL